MIIQKDKLHNLTPIQPYLVLQADNYEKILLEQYGISEFYQFNLNDTLKNDLKAVPDGSVDILFSISENKVRTYIGGTVLKAKYWPLYDGNTYFGIRFEPGKCILPDDLSISDIVNNDIELDTRYFRNNLSEKIAQSNSIKDRANKFLNEYKNLFQKNNHFKSNTYPLENYIRNKIYESKGNISIQRLSKETGYSECYLRRAFRNVHGISPKSFEKFVRFQYLLNRISKINADNVDIALKCGYYDESHMIKDFKCFTGTTPEAYKSMIKNTTLNNI